MIKSVYCHGRHLLVSSSGDVWIMNGNTIKLVNACIHVPAAIHKNVRYKYFAIFGCDGKNHCVFVHRLVACAFIRPVLRSEDVHHKNGDTQDNRPENLEILPHAEHVRQHRRRRVYKRRYQFSYVLVTDKQTDEEMQFPTMAAASRHIGHAKDYIVNYLYVKKSENALYKWELIP